MQTVAPAITNDGEAEAITAGDAPPGAKIILPPADVLETLASATTRLLGRPSWIVRSNGSSALVLLILESLSFAMLRDALIFVVAASAAPVALRVAFRRRAAPPRSSGRT